MFKVLSRFFCSLISSRIDIDRLAQKYPVSVKAIIEDDGRYLVLKNENKEWDLPGGKLIEEQTIHENLRREVKEETNLDIEVKDLIYVDLHKINKTSVLIVIFNVKINSTEPIIISHEHFEFRFCNLIDLKKMPTPSWLREFIGHKL